MNILIIRLSAIGDVFFCTSLVRALKEMHPGCRVTWLSEPVGAGIVRGHPLVDRVITLPRREWTKAFKSGRWGRLVQSMKAFSAELRDEHYDLVIDPQGLLKSAIWARSARADRRIGVNGYDGSSLLYDTVVRVKPDERPPMLQEYRQLVELLGGDPSGVRMQLHYSDEDRREAEAFLRAHNAAAPVVFCPFTTRPQKHWFDEEWARLGDLLASEDAGPVVILGGPADGEHAERIATAMRSQPVIAAGERRSIGFALALIAQAKGLVGVDTGLTHAGIAFDRPTVALFGSTRPYVETHSPRARVLFHDLDCAPCRRRPTCNGRFDCMRLHTAVEVGRQLAELMAVRD